MLFNSVHYLLFLPIAVLAYFLTPQRLRWAILFVLSCYFYMVFIPYYILILFVLILVDYLAGMWIEDAKGHKRRLFLLLSIVANVGILGTFKYFNFFNHNLAWAAQHLGVDYTASRLSLALPIGLSFHTFQSMSYTLEVYYGRFKAERHLGVYAVYVLFFPQMVAGPIERPQNIIPQLHQEKKFDYSLAVDGLRLIFLGLLRKVLIADNLAGFVDAVYHNPRSHEGPALLVATLCFTFQIYCDFSGYSDIARGSAKLLGIELMVNFKRPYMAGSVSDFWRRWHISLSTWFRDYLYIPLGGNRASSFKHARNLFITFVVSGLWHGANWTYVVWGALHGAYLVIETYGKRWLGADKDPKAPPSIAGRALTFLAVMYAWIYFRAESMEDALHISKHLFQGWNAAGVAALLTIASKARLAFYVLLVTGLLVFERAAERGPLVPRFVGLPRPLRWSVYYAGVLAVAFLGSSGAKQFIYFQF